MYMQTSTYQQVNHYYPYGGVMGESTGGDIQPYKYNGKELNRMHGLDWYDYGARHYDAAIVSWPTMDPLAEKYYSISPYAYYGDNPVRFVDPNGEVWTDFDGNLNMYSCHSADKTHQKHGTHGELSGSKDPIAYAFAKKFNLKGS